jgi:M6 family metalloprotease-like protein
MTSLAIPLPKMEDIAQYKADGRWPQVQRYLSSLHDSAESRLSDGQLLRLVEDGYGLPTSRREGAPSPSAQPMDNTQVSAPSGGRQGGPPTVASPRANLDGNSVVDERDILELGYMPAASRRASVTLPYGTAAAGNQPKCLLLLLKFPDQAPTDAKNQGSEFDINHDAQWAHDKWFNLSAPAGGDLEDASVAYYYQQASYGQLELDGDVFNNPAVCDAEGWLTSGFTYAEMRTSMGSYGAIIDDAISQIDPYVDFRDYDSNGDGFIDGLITVYAGPDDLFAGGDAWYFRWLSDPGAVTSDDVRIAQGVWVSEEGYLQTYCHEFGHELGLPDLYDVGGGGSGPNNQGSGMWDLMADWDANTGRIPPLPNAWCRTRLRWATPVDVLTTGDTGITLNNASTATSPLDTVYRIWRNGAFGPEYFLLEYRDATAGFDQNLQGGGGILVWHIDEGSTTGNNRDNDFDDQRVTFEPADWDYFPSSHNNDPWRSGFNGADAKDSFDDTATPSAKDNAGVNTGVLIDPTNGPGGATMSATVHNAGVGLPSLSIDAPAAGASLSGDVSFDVTSNAAARVEYYVNGCLKFVENASGPYDGFTWDTLSTFNGDCTLRVVAYNAGSDSVRVLERSVTVDNPQSSGASLSFTDNFNSYSGGQDPELLGSWNLHGDAFGLSIRHLTIDGASSPGLAFAQSVFGAPPFDGNSPDPDQGAYEGQDDEWLMSPRINLAGYSNLQLSYKLAFRSAWSGDALLQTQITTDDGATWHDLAGQTYAYTGPLDDANNTGEWDPSGQFTNFAQRTLDLDDYINEQVYLRFLFVGGGGYNVGFAIDDLSLTGTALVLSSVSPARTTVGSSITLTGSGFGASQGSGSVRFSNGAGGHVEQPTVNSWDDTQIVCNVPAGAKSHTTAGIWVRTGAGIDTNARQFKVVLPPPVLGGLEQK